MTSNAPIRLSELGRKSEKWMPICELYSKSSSEIFSFSYNGAAVGVEGVNANQIAAVEFIGSRVNGEGMLISVTGPMSAGKTALSFLLADSLGKKLVPFMHRFDYGRVGERDVLKTWGSGQEVKAVPFSCLSEVKKYLDNECLEGSLVYIDEYQFAELGVDFGALRELARRKNLIIVAGGLDFNFARSPWPNLGSLLENVDFGVHLCAQCTCDGCNNSAVYTNLVDEFGNPVSRDIDVVQVGEAGGKYHAVCVDHHFVAEDMFV